MADGHPRDTGVVALGIAIVGLGLFFLVGAFLVAGEAAYAGVGPRVFPILIGTGLTAAGVVFTWQVLRRPLPVSATAAAAAVDRGSLVWIAAGLAIAIVVIQIVGFALTSAVLFVTTSRAFGSRRPARDGLVGLLLGTVIFFAFARLLGISLPGGPFDWFP